MPRTAAVWVAREQEPWRLAGGFEYTLAADWLERPAPWHDNRGQRVSGRPVCRESTPRHGGRSVPTHTVGWNTG